MPLILNIDTATTRASVSLALNGLVLQERTNGKSMDHAAWIHVAVKEIMKANGTIINELDAIAVVAGPGSYTGIRVGMATAKGLCYAVNIPLVSLNTLAIMAHAIRKEMPAPVLLCPMLDARRMEVFTALYNTTMQELVQPCAMILDEYSFSTWLNAHKIIFSGSGSTKWKEVVQHNNAVFTDVFYTPQHIAFLADSKCVDHAFSELAYTEPVYLKDFYSNQHIQ